MKKTGLFLIALTLTAANLFAAIKVESDINSGTAWGKTKKFVDMPKEITVGLFNINYMTSRVAQAAAGKGISRAAIMILAEFDLTDADAQAITNEAYAYLKQQLEAKGYAVKVNDAEVLKNTKVFQKYAKKDPTAVVNTGAPYRITSKDKVDEHIKSYATGVPGAYLGAGGGTGYVPLAIELAGNDGQLSLSVVGTVDFTVAETKASKANTLDDYNRASVTFIPTLRLLDNPHYGQSSFNYNSTKAIGGKVFGGNVYKYEGNDWIASDGMDKDSIWRHNIAVDGYKKATLSLLQAYIDQLIVRVDEAKASGK